ncbi:uncharacterized protein LOC141940957 [Strix uralensis]|uniref:uncharacterized protein LOC141940957 n=1 Tax=Strix uralensis TaxID=36305 RepID=UPI003DA7227E
MGQKGSKSRGSGNPRRGSQRGSDLPDISQDSPLGCMLKNWYNWPETKGKSKEKMIQYCIVEWTKEPIKSDDLFWPKFGTTDDWTCQALNSYVRNKKPYNQEECNYTQVWRGSRITSKILLLKNKNTNKKTFKEKEWEPLENLSPPHEGSSEDEEPKPTAPSPPSTSRTSNQEKQKQTTNSGAEVWEGVGGGGRPLGPRHDPAPGPGPPAAPQGGGPTAAAPPRGLRRALRSERGAGGARPGNKAESEQQILQMCSGVDPTSPVGEALLKTQFVAKSWGDTREKLKKLDDWQDQGLQELLREVQKVYVRRDEEKQRVKAKILVAAVRETQRREEKPPRSRSNESPGALGGEKRGTVIGENTLACYYCGKKGHLQRNCRKRERDERMFKEE